MDDRRPINVYDIFSNLDHWGIFVSQVSATFTEVRDLLNEYKFDSETDYWRTFTIIMALSKSDWPINYSIDEFRSRKDTSDMFNGRDDTVGLVHPTKSAGSCDCDDCRATAGTDN